MASNLSFNTQGANPNDMLNTYRSNTPAVGAGTAQAMALNKAQSSPITPPTASTPLKKTTTNNADGSSTVHEYHAPAAPGSPQAAAKQQETDVKQYFPGMIGGSGTSTTPATPATPAVQTPPVAPKPYDASVQGLINTGTQGSDAVNAANEALKNFKLANANTGAAIQSDPNYSLDTKTGVGAIVANRAAQELPAYETAVSNALAGQGQKITALSSAGSLSTPAQTQTALSPAQTLYSTTGPNAGSAVAGLNAPGTSGNTALDSAVALYADKVKNGMSYNDAVSALSQYGPQAQQALTAALGPGFNINANLGAANATRSNVQTAGTAAVDAANTGYSSANTEYQDNVGKYSALTGISNQVASTLANYANVGSLTDVNAAINTLQGHLSNPDYQKFITAIGNTQAAYQGILGSSGVTPTKADQDAIAALNPNSSASTIIAALNQLSADAHALIIEPSYQKVQNYKKTLGIQ